jgi:hypothetical protein
MPVKIMAMSCSLAAAMTSSSLTEPPGWTAAVAPCVGRLVDPVPEGEERIGGHHGAFRGEPGVAGLDDGQLGGVDPAHLACAHAHELVLVA